MKYTLMISAALTLSMAAPWQTAPVLGQQTERILDPTVSAVLGSNPQTPAQLFSSVHLLIRLKHASHAKGFLATLTAANLDEAAMSDLVERFGSPAFFDVMNEPALQPEGKQFAETVLSAAFNYARSPERLNALVAKLNDPSPDVRRRAALRLRVAGPIAAGPLVAALENAGDDDHKANIRAALLLQGGAVAPPLLAVLKSGSPELQGQVIQVLSQLESDLPLATFLIGPALKSDVPPVVKTAAANALKEMLGKVPSTEEAVYLLQLRADQYFEMRQPLQTDLEDKVMVWQWDDGAKEMKSALVAKDLASTQWAAQLAADAYALTPENVSLRRLQLATSLEAASLAAGESVALPDGAARQAATALGSEALLDMIHHYLNTSHTPACAAALQVLKEVGNADLLFTHAPRASLVVEAAVHGDRRVRLAALQAIVAWNADRPYPGANFVQNSLGFLSSTLGLPRAVVADARVDEARRLAGLLAGMGYDAEVATNGRDLFKLAAERSDCELVLISVNLGHVWTEIALRELRKDGRTSMMPVGVVGSPDEKLRARAVAMEDTLTAPIIRPNDTAGLKLQVDLLMQQVGRRRVATDERLAQSAWAVATLNELTKTQQPMYDWKRLVTPLQLALLVPSLSPDAAASLGHIGTPEAQTTLVEMASVGATQLSTRKAAAAAFADATKRWTILLTTQQILLQYSRYNASENSDADSQAILASILDALEANLPKSEPPMSTRRIDETTSR